MRDIQWRWVLAGIVFIYGSQLLLAVAAPLVGGEVEQLQTYQALLFGYALFSFFIGGFVVGLLSPGTTIVEPPLAAFGAMLLDIALPPPAAAQLASESWTLTVLTGLPLAFVGGWLGERLPTPTGLRAPRLFAWLALLVLVFGVPAGIVALGLPVWLAVLVVAALAGFVYWRLANPGARHIVG